MCEPRHRRPFLCRGARSATTHRRRRRMRFTAMARSLSTSPSPSLFLWGTCGHAFWVPVGVPPLCARALTRASNSRRDVDIIFVIETGASHAVVFVRVYRVAGLTVVARELVNRTRTRTNTFTRMGTRPCI